MSLSPWTTSLLVAAFSTLLVWANPASAQHDMEPPVGTPETYPTIHVQGFSDFEYTASDDSIGPRGFQLGQLVVHAVSRLAKKVTFFGEVSATPRSNQFSVEVERSFVRYDYNDLLKLSVGRFHTPIGYWNNAYHHGLWLQTTVRRPEQVAFGGVYTPVHFVGLLAEGTIPSRPIGLTYRAGVGNGRSEILSRGGDAGDANGHRAWLAQLVARPGNRDGLEIGGSVYEDRLSPSGGPAMSEWIFSGHAVWIRETPELLAELIAVRHEDQQTGTEYDSRSYYVQAGYRLPGRAHPFKPYARYEKMDIATGEPVFAFPDHDVVTAGIRIDLVDLAALKAEYRNERFEGSGRADGVLLQTCFTF